MDLFERISKDIVSAMKAKDKNRLDALRNVKKLFLEAKTSPGANDTLTDERHGQGDGHCHCQTCWNG